MRYKVWIEIEELDDGGEPTGGETVLPDSLGTFDTLEGAMAAAWDVVREKCPDPEHSDCRPRPTAKR